MKTFEKFMFAEQVLNNRSLYQGDRVEELYGNLQAEGLDPVLQEKIKDKDK